MTVADLLPATNSRDYLQLVGDWAKTTWAAWSKHHELVRGWATDAHHAIGRA